MLESMRKIDTKTLLEELRADKLVLQNKIKELI